MEELKMKLKKLVLQNIGVFVDRNEVNLDCDKPIILIGGMNGRGKTTILEAVLFALYGQYVGNLLGNSLKLTDYLYKISNTRGQNKDCYVKIEFEIQTEDTLQNYTVKRSWNAGLKNIRLQTEVCKNGLRDNTLSQNWDMFIEEILPHAIAPFFFFDGEKIAELASSENDEQIGNSIKGLLGIDVIDRLIQDLEVVENRKEKEIKNNLYSTELAMVNQQSEDINRLIIKLNQEIKSNQKKSEILRLRLKELEENYSIIGGSYAEKRNYTEKEYQTFREKKKKIDNDLVELAMGDLPLILCKDLLYSIFERVQEEREQKELHLLAQRLPLIYEEFCSKNNSIENIASFLNFVKTKATNETYIYKFEDDAYFRLKKLNKSFKSSCSKALTLIEEKRKIEKKLEDLENYLLIKVDDKQVNSLFQIIKDKTAEKAIIDERIVQENGELEKSLQQLKTINNNKDRLLNKVVEGYENSDEAKRIINYIQKQIGLLKKYKLEVQKLKVKELSQQMTNCFKNLIAKEGLINDIIINSETLSFTYYNSEGQKVNKMALSAGEKQLLVIAMLWALAICSKVEFPLVIDTPLARLDSEHRNSLIRNYFPYASKQVIILSTDQEITDDDYSQIKPFVGREFTLEYQEDEKKSIITDGYFGRT